jgi:hypothetical protein
MACRRCLLTYVLASRYERETPTSRGRARNPAARTQPGRHPSLRRRHNQSGASRSKTPAELTHRRGKRGRLRNRGRLLWTPLTQPGESAPPVEELVDDPRLGKRRRFLATVPVVAAVETPAASDLCTDAPEGAPPRRGTQRRTRHRRMTTVSSTSSFRRRRRGRLLGVKPQAEAPHLAPVASRGAMHRRHRRRTCRARVHSAPSIRAAACARAREASVPRRCCACTDGPGMESELISSAARARQGARREERAGRW